MTAQRDTLAGAWRSAKRSDQEQFGRERSQYWLSRHSRSVIFLIAVVALLGGYLASTIPVSVFPATNFPRIFVAVDNGVMPIDQMRVMVTRPLEEAVNSVPGLQSVRSITSRGS